MKLRFQFLSVFAFLCSATASHAWAQVRAQVPAQAPAKSSPLGVEAERGFFRAEASMDPFSKLVRGGQSEEPQRQLSIQIQRYAITGDARAFLLENEGRRSRIKFLCGPGDRRFDCMLNPTQPSEEIYSLRMRPSSGGGSVYRDRRGAIVLKIASHGGATVYWPGDGRGLAASEAIGDETSLRLPFASVSMARALSEQAATYLSARVGAPIDFDLGTPATDPSSGAAVLYDTIARTARGVFIAAGAAASDQNKEAFDGRIKMVRFSAGPTPEIRYAKNVVMVTYNPAADMDGRLSSAQVARFLTQAMK
ncbi:MAG: DUF4908 domain-containing protein [Pseudomonadota bacterium]